MSDRTEGREISLRVEYQEINQWLRHIELAWWAVYAVLIPLTAGVMYKSVENTYILYFGGGSIVLMWLLYTSFTKFVEHQSLQIMRRAAEIERLLDMKFVMYEDDRFGKVSNDDLANLISKKDSGFFMIIKWIYKLIPLNIRFSYVMYIMGFIVIVLWGIMVTCQVKGYLPHTGEQSSQKTLKKKEITNNKKEEKHENIKK